MEGTNEAILCVLLKGQRELQLMGEYPSNFYQEVIDSLHDVDFEILREEKTLILMVSSESNEEAMEEMAMEPAITSAEKLIQLNEFVESCLTPVDSYVEDYVPFVPLHNIQENAEIWKSQLDVERVKDQFGERVALYFLLMRFFMKFQILFSFSLVVTIYYLLRRFLPPGSHWGIYIKVLSVLGYVIWAICLSRKFKCHLSRLVHRWDLFKSDLEEEYPDVLLYDYGIGL